MHQCFSLPNLPILNVAIDTFEEMLLPFQPQIASLVNSVICLLNYTFHTHNFCTTNDKCLAEIEQNGQATLRTNKGTNAGGKVLLQQDVS